MRKTIDLDTERVKMCAAAIAGDDVPIMIGLQRRYDSTHGAVRRAIDNGDIGNVEVISIVNRDPKSAAAFIAVSGGQFHDQMIHDFEMALWLSCATGRFEIAATASNLGQRFHSLNHIRLPPRACMTKCE